MGEYHFEIGEIHYPLVDVHRLSGFTWKVFGQLFRLQTDRDIEFDTLAVERIALQIGRSRPKISGWKQTYFEPEVLNGPFDFFQTFLNPIGIVADVGNDSAVGFVDHLGGAIDVDALEQFLMSERPTAPTGLEGILKTGLAPLFDSFLIDEWLCTSETRHFRHPGCD